MNPATRQGVRKQNALTEFLKRRWIDAELAKAMEEEVDLHHHHQHQTPPPLLPHELHELILMSLPAKSLLRLQLVCKKWFNLINTSFFIQAHAHAHQFDTLLISRSTTTRQSIVDGRQKFWFHFLSLEDGGSSFVDESQPIYEVRASCDGLIVACDKYRTLTLLNPLTRQNIELPTPVLLSNPFQESFGMAYCNEARSYKVVHVYRRGYEILTVGSGEWRSIEGPHECILFREGSVSIGGSLHWLSISSRGTVSCLSMNVCDETFVRVVVPVPAAGATRVVGDKLVEIDGDLGYVAHAEANNRLLLQVWILIRGCWTFRYSIRTPVACIPICCRRKGKDLVLETSDNRRRLYAHDLERDELKPVISPGCDDEQPGFGPIHSYFFPHHHTLVPIV